MQSVVVRLRGLEIIQRNIHAAPADTAGALLVNQAGAHHDLNVPGYACNEMPNGAANSETRNNFSPRRSSMARRTESDSAKNTRSSSSSWTAAG